MKMPLFVNIEDGGINERGMFCHRHFQRRKTECSGICSALVDGQFYHQYFIPAAAIGLMCLHAAQAADFSFSFKEMNRSQPVHAIM